MLKGTHGYTTFQGGQDVHKLDRKVTEIVEAVLKAKETVASSALGDVRFVKAASGQ